jgi:predicted enzyme related to lactoylglutathione lyase
MTKVTGIGGIFIKCRHVPTMRAWYEQHLGIKMEDWGATFQLKEDTHPAPYTAFSLFSGNSNYFAPSDSSFMINFRVADLDALIVELKAAGIELAGEPVEEEYGKFAWVMDPEGNKIELWQQPTP